MNKLFQILVIALFAFNYANAQPGGGGGIVIVEIYDQNLKEIDINDSSLEMRTFVLKNQSEKEEIYKESFLEMVNYPIGAIYLPPQSGYKKTKIKGDYRFQRLSLIYRGDTMIIDFTGIIDENGSGRFDSIDSLIFQAGYFRYYRNKLVILKPHNDDNLSSNVELSGGILKGNEKNGFTYFMKCTSQGSIQSYGPDNLIIQGFPVLLKKDGQRGLYRIELDTILFGNESSFSTCINKSIFIYGFRTIIENSNTFFLSISYYKSIDTAIERYVPFLYYNVNNAIIIRSENIKIIPCQQQVYMPLDYPESTTVMIPFLTRKKFYRNRYEKKVKRWRKRNCE